MKMSGAELIVALLERQGIDILAGIPGGANLPIYDALGRNGRIRHVLARHEQGAGFMAQGAARVTGKCAVAMATSGPGATNLLTAIADAKLDSVPIVCITGQVPRAMMGSDAFQEVDTYGMSIPATKHNFLARSAAELLEAVPRAFAIAASDRPGPVLIDVPKDVQMEEVEFDAWPEPGGPGPAPPFDKSDLDRAAALINASERPLLCLGGGVISSGASEVALELAETAGLPVTMTLMALGAVRTDHPLHLGMPGMHGPRCTNMAIEECDLFIAVGARFDDRATGRLDAFCPTAKVLHIDIDASEIDKIRPAHVGIVADAREFLTALVPRVGERAHPAWLERIARLKSEHPLVRPGVDDPRTPYGLIAHVAAVAAEDAIIATDVGQHQMWVAQSYPLTRARSWLTSGGLGTMGFGLPAAIGAALAWPQRSVVCFSGDGSLLMNIQELATAVEEDVDVKIVLMNNNSLGLVHQQQALFYGGRVYQADYRTSVDFCRVAEGFGMATVDLATSTDPAAAIERAFARRGPCLVHAPISAEEMVYPMVPPGAANKDMIGGQKDA